MAISRRDACDWRNPNPSFGALDLGRATQEEEEERRELAIVFGMRSKGERKCGRSSESEERDDDELGKGIFIRS